MDCRHVAEQVGRSIRRLIPATLLALSGAAAAQADLCVVSYATNQVLRYDETTGSPAGVCAAGGGLLGPIGVAVGPDGNVYVSSSGNHSILRYDGVSGAFVDAFVPSGVGGMYEPQGLTFGPDGNLYVASFVWVLRYNGVTGAFMGVFADRVFGGVFGLTFGPDGNLYVGTFGNVQRFDGTTGAFMDVFARTGLAGATGLAFGSSQDLFVGSNLSNEVVRFDGVSGALVGPFVTPGSGGLSGPTGVGFGHDGRLYVASRDRNAVLRYDATSGSFIDAFVPSGGGGLGTPVFFTFFTPPTATTVAIDIKPGSTTNPINPRSQGIVVVAVLTTPEFDASSVDVERVSFGLNGTEAGPVHWALEDVDRDHDVDLVLHFRTQSTGLSCGATSASLTGTTLNGLMIQGVDSIRTVGCP